MTIQATPAPQPLRPGDQTETADEIRVAWENDPRWDGIERTYSAEDVVRLRGSVREESTLARRGAENLWNLIHTEEYVRALGAYTGGQAVQQVRAGLKAIYLSGWQVAADGNLAGQTYPDQSLYPANSVPAVVRRINNALLRQDQIERAEGEITRDWLAPIVADAEAGFGGPLNAYELAQSLIQAGAAGIHWEDQLASEKKCGHLGGKVLVPIQQHIRTLNAARLAADVAGVPTVIIARTDALAADLLTSDVDPRDAEFLTGERTTEGFYRVRPGLDSVIARGLAFAPYADLLWVETGEPDIELARRFAEAIHARYPGKKLAYNCSPSFNWKRHPTGLLGGAAATPRPRRTTRRRRLAARQRWHPRPGGRYRASPGGAGAEVATAGHGIPTLARQCFSRSSRRLSGCPSSAVDSTCSASRTARRSRRRSLAPSMRL
ncbi:isocitrate lyase [Microbacterium testaceum]|uniref:isocitrate lyase n=1 Tax=Microbacterium TaxID=33882 RepID=UPI002784F9A3|nr:MULTISPECIES: isocitrate lyase [Microbacterium]MDQ1111466.1 isocitrate lyase [Microbacterium testaceum]MDR6097997.1 isocitrate lyase [Microbacterium sp. SORGH_AS_0454]